VMVPIPGTTARFAMVLPQPDGTIYIGLTDEPVTGPVPDVPTPSEAEIAFLLDVVGSAFSSPPTRADVVGACAGLRPLLEVAGTDTTADLSRRHAILTSAAGVTTVVGGKLTTYRRMAQDVVDRLTDRPCRTHRLPLVGAAPRAVLGTLAAPERLVRRYGTEAPAVVALADGRPELLEPVADGVPACGAELLWAARHELALTPEDLADRRTRAGLVPEWRDAVLARAVNVDLPATVRRSGRSTAAG
jgi:glycerol-3-phosphate dehydrogenase